MDSKTVSCYFVGYSEKSKDYKFFDPTIKSFFETRNARFFEEIEFEWRDKVKDIIFKE